MCFYEFTYFFRLLCLLVHKFVCVGSFSEPLCHILMIFLILYLCSHSSLVFFFCFFFQMTYWLFGSILLKLHIFGLFFTIFFLVIDLYFLIIEIRYDRNLLKGPEICFVT